METVAVFGLVAVVVGCGTGGLLSVMGRRADDDGPSPWPLVVVIVAGMACAVVSALGEGWLE